MKLRPLERLRWWLVKRLVGNDCAIIGFARLNMPSHLLNKPVVWHDKKSTCHIGCDIISRNAAEWEKCKGILETT